CLAVVDAIFVLIAGGEQSAQEQEGHDGSEGFHRFSFLSASLSAEAAAPCAGRQSPLSRSTPISPVRFRRGRCSSFLRSVLRPAYEILRQQELAGKAGAADRDCCRQAGANLPKGGEKLCARDVNAA